LEIRPVKSPRFYLKRLLSSSAYNYGSTPRYNTTGFVAVDRTHQLIVVAFRGTEDCDLSGLAPAGNCLAGVDSLVTTAVPQFCAGCEIGAGWLGAWNEVRGDVLEAVNAARITNPGFRVLSTGHSLGGALATVAGIELRSKGYIVDLVNSTHRGHVLLLILALQTPFASPRIVNTALALFVSSQDDHVTTNRSRNRRVTHTGDGVNNLPTAISALLPGIPEYFHFEPSYLITSGNGPATVTFSDVDILPGIDLMVPMLPVLTPAGVPDEVGINATAIAHSIYLNRISQCFAPGPETQTRLVTELSFPIRAIV
jgi:Lipase (class 3)